MHNYRIVYSLRHHNFEYPDFYRFTGIRFSSKLDYKDEVYALLDRMQKLREKRQFLGEAGAFYWIEELVPDDTY